MAYDTTKADTLYMHNLFKGTDSGYALEKTATRAEAAVMLIRLLGKEQTAKEAYASGQITCIFDDVPEWAKSAVAWLHESRYLNGISAAKYGSNSLVTCQQYAAFILRALNYNETNGDFTYKNALTFAVDKKILTSSEAHSVEAFLRGDMVSMSYNALYQPMNGSADTLYQKLESEGVFENAPSSPMVQPTPELSTKTLNLSLKYQGGGKDSQWFVEPATGCSPVTLDLDGDGAKEILYSGMSLFCLNAATGATKWRVKAGTDRSTNQSTAESFGYTSINMLVGDFDSDGGTEILVAHSNGNSATGCVSMYDSNGYFKSGWPKKLSYPVNALYAADLDRDGRSEICVGLGTGNTDNSLYVFEPDGSTRTGWPRPCGNGLYANAVTSADLDGDGALEIVALNDTEHIFAFKANGNALTATAPDYDGCRWSGLPLVPDYDFEMKLANWASIHGEAWATSDLVLGDTWDEKECFMGTIGGIGVSDVDNNGSSELVICGLIADASQVMRGENKDTFKNSARYFTTFVLNFDRGRYKNAAKGFSWVDAPKNTGTPLLMNPYVLPYANGTPAISDYNGDGFKDICFSGCDGLVHCYGLNGKELSGWPFNVYADSNGVAAYASAPISADLNGDGVPESIFTSYTRNDQLQQRGKLYIVNGAGKVLASTVIPTKVGDGDYAPNGCMAKPLVADVDGDGSMEIVLTSMFSGLMVYDIT